MAKASPRMKWTNALWKPGENKLAWHSHTLRAAMSRGSAAGNFRPCLTIHVLWLQDTWYKSTVNTWLLETGKQGPHLSVKRCPANFTLCHNVIHQRQGSLGLLPSTSDAWLHWNLLSLWTLMFMQRWPCLSSQQCTSFESESAASANFPVLCVPSAN